MLIGELAHQFLENWDFGGDKNLLRHQLGAFLSASLSAEYSQDAGSIGEELQAILERFINSPIYAELRRARILGREVPLLMPWNGQIMEGVIDLIYERNGLLYLADYKTDRAAAKDLRFGAERYRRQAEIYSEAARRSLKREVAAFKLIFLRLRRDRRGRFQSRKGAVAFLDVIPENFLFRYRNHPHGSVGSRS